MEKMLDQTGVKLSPELKAEIEVAIRTYAPGMSAPAFIRLAVRVLLRLIRQHGPLAIMSHMMGEERS